MAGKSASLEDESDPSEAERVWREAQVDAVLERHKAALGEGDLAWVRARLLEALTDDPAARELSRAAFPRDADQSGEVFYGNRKPR